MQLIIDLERCGKLVKLKIYECLVENECLVLQFLDPWMLRFCLRGCEGKQKCNYNIRFECCFHLSALLSLGALFIRVSVTDLLYCFPHRQRFFSAGNFITDIMMSSSHAELAILNSGTLRSDMIHPPGLFRTRDLLAILPLVDPIVVLKVTGTYIEVIRVTGTYIEVLKVTGTHIEVLKVTGTYIVVLKVTGTYIEVIEVRVS